MKKVTNASLIWNANDFNSNLENIRISNEITEETFFELMKMSPEDKVEQLEAYIEDNQAQIIELINDIITRGMIDEYANNNQK